MCIRDSSPTAQTEKQNGWEVVMGASQASMDGITFIVAVSTFTQNDISWCAVSIFNDEKFAAIIDNFLLGVQADSKKFVKKLIRLLRKTMKQL